MGVFIRKTTLGCVLAMIMALGAAGAAQAAWSGVGTLTGGRYSHTATLLKDGRVLVAGGNDSAPLKSAQLYDPAANTWSSAGTMSLARTGQAAALLDSGKVLVAGGMAPDADPASSTGAYTRSAELYNPATNTWTATGDMAAARFQPTMTVLPDGRVLVAGGSGGDAASPLASAEIYDPSTGSWDTVAPMSVARAMATATLLKDGKVLVAGGYDGTGELAGAEVYDAVHNTWSPTGSLADGRDSATATELQNGDVLLAGGDGGDGHTLASAEVYDAGKGTWHAAASMAAARQTAAAALLDDGTVLVTGGDDAAAGTVLGSAEVYNPSEDAWSPAGSMAAPRKQHTLTVLNDGRALVVGGNAGGFDRGLTGVERFSTMTTTLTDASFGTELVGTSSDVVKSVLANTGTSPLVVTGVSVGGANPTDFSVESESCVAAPIQPGGTCEVDLRFSPKAAGPRSAKLTLADNSTAAGVSTASATGTGQADTPPAGDGTTTLPGDTGGPVGAGQPTGGAGTPTGSSGASKPASQAVRGAAARSTCKIKTTHGRSTVTCTTTMPARTTVALRARLLRGKTVMASARTTARKGQVRVTLRPARRLRSGRYTVAITRSNGAVVLRRQVRVS
jgi:N-acetylneuraminic acid mutarotase